MTKRISPQEISSRSVGPLLLILEAADSVMICRAESAAQARIENFILAKRDRMTRGRVADQRIFSGKVWRQLRESDPRSFPACDNYWGKWFTESFAIGRPAPVDVAQWNTTERTLGNVQAGVAGLSLAAGACGDKIGATVLTVVGIALSLAKANGLICTIP